MNVNCLTLFSHITQIKLVLPSKSLDAGILKYTIRSRAGILF